MITPEPGRPAIPYIGTSRLSQLCGVTVLFIGATVLLGWTLHDRALIQIFSGLVGMVVNTAICLSLAGLCLALPKSLHYLPLIRRVCGIFLVVAATLVLSQSLFNVNLGIDWPELHEWLDDANPRPGRMAPNTCIGLIAAGLLLSMSGMRFGRRGIYLQRTLIVATIAIGLSGLFGYFIKLELLYDLSGVTRMALHTAIAMTLLGLGLWAETRPISSVRTLKEGGRIMAFAAGALVVVAIVSGVSVFTFMQNRIERMTGDHLMASHRDHALYFHNTIQQRTERAQTITTRPNALLMLRQLSARPGDPGPTAALQKVAQSYLPHGFTWVAFYQNGRFIAHAGKPVTNPTLEVALYGGPKRELFWHNGFYLRTYLAMRDEQGKVGDVIAEQPLEVLTELAGDANRSGETGEMGFCSLLTPALNCFPQRFRPQSYSVPHEIDGKPLPMSLAKSGKSGVVSTLDYRRQHVLAAYGPVGNLGLGIVIKMDWAELYAPVRSQLQIILAILIVLVALSLWLLHRRLQPMVTQLLASKHAAEANEARFLAAAENGLDGFYILEAVRDPNGKILDFEFSYLNENGAKLISTLPKQSLLGQNVGEVLPLIRTGGHLDKYTLVIQTGVPLKEEFSISAPGVTAKWLSQQVVRLGDGVAITARDITARKLAEEKLKYLAQNDTLTGLPNRALFRDRLEQAMGRARRRDKAMGIMYLDIDHFKKINDSLGHAAGDEVLRAFGYRLSCSVRATDTVARLAGDEFTVILEELRGPADAQLVAEKILTAIVPPVKMGEDEIHISSSIGIAIYHKEKTTTDELMEQADRALYSVKRRGRGGYKIYSEELENASSASIESNR
jgi:diguanylate cyclase (GGDEF)-like protein